MKYSQNRHRSGISKIELELALKIISDYFTEKWLNENKDHPLQQLWKRKDVLATTELFTFGASLLSIQNQDKNWINNNIDRIKRGNANNIMGFVFEIIAAAMIKNGNDQELILPPSDNPAIDLIIKLDDGRIANISCKNHGLSDRNKLFDKNAEELENLFLEVCKKFKKNRIQCIIQALRYVEYDDWDILRLNMENLVKNFNDEYQRYILAETWHIDMTPFNKGEVRFSDDYLTYTFLVMSPFYEFERKRLEDRFEKACYDLDKYQIKQDSNDINIIMVHLPETASLNRCYAWAQQYLNEYPDKPIAGIIFIQNLIVRNIGKKREENQSFIEMGVRTVFNSHYDLWMQKSVSKSKIKLKTIILGRITYEPSQSVILNCGRIVDSSNINLDDRYIYQRGERYIEYKIENEGVNVELSNYAPGVHEYGIVIYETGEKKLVKPDFSPQDKLILI